MKSAYVYFAGVNGVRVTRNKHGWQVQIQPEYNNEADDRSWVDVNGGLFCSKHQAVENASDVVPETHVF